MSQGTCPCSVELCDPGADSNEKYATARKEDPTLQLVIGLVENGLPEHKRDCPVPAKPFWSEKVNWATADGLFLRGHQVVVSFSLRPNMLKQIHGVHFGETKCLERAKLVVYWPK